MKVRDLIQCLIWYKGFPSRCACEKILVIMVNVYFYKMGSRTHCVSERDVIYIIVLLMHWILGNSLVVAYDTNSKVKVKGNDKDKAESKVKCPNITQIRLQQHIIQIEKSRSKLKTLSWGD